MRQDDLPCLAGVDLFDEITLGAWLGFCGGALKTIALSAHGRLPPRHAKCILSCDAFLPGSMGLSLGAALLQFGHRRLLPCPVTKRCSVFETARDANLNRAGWGYVDKRPAGPPPPPFGRFRFLFSP